MFQWLSSILLLLWLALYLCSLSINGFKVISWSIDRIHCYIMNIYTFLFFSIVIGYTLRRQAQSELVAKGSKR